MYYIKKTTTKLIYKNDDFDYHSSETEILHSFQTITEALNELKNYNLTKTQDKIHISITEYYVELDNGVIIFAD